MFRLAAALVVVLAGCAGAQGGAEEGDDALVPVVRVTAGEPDTLEVPALPRTDLQFGEHPDVAVSVLNARRIVVAAAPDFAGLATVPFRAGGASYVLPVEVAARPEVTFAFEPPLRPLQVAYEPETFVVFEDPALAPLRLRDPERDGVLEGTVPLAPGRYAYVLRVEGEDRLDPASPDSVRVASGGYRSVRTVEPTGRLALDLVGPDPEAPDVLLFSLIRHDASGTEVPTGIDEEEGVVALLGNQPFEDNAIDAFEDYVRLDLDAAGPGRQRLRLAARVDGLVSNWVEVDLVDGRLAEG